MPSTFESLKNSLGYQQEIDNIKTNNTPGIDSISEVYDDLNGKIVILQESLSGSPSSTNYREVTGTTTATTTDYTLNITVSADTIVVLPDSTNITNKTYNVKNSDITNNGYVIFNTSNGELIDGYYDNNNLLKFKYPKSLTVQSTGNGWILI